MWNTYLFDWRDNPQVLASFQKKGGKKLPGAPSRNVNTGNYTFERLQELNMPAVLFIHSATIARENWIEAFNANMIHGEIYLVFCHSGDPFTRDNLTKNEFHLKVGLDEWIQSTEADAFFESVKDGNPNWRLLAPKPKPEYLLACYLMLLCSKETSLPDGEWPKWQEQALKEYKEIFVSLKPEMKTKELLEINKIDCSNLESIGALLKAARDPI